MRVHRRNPALVVVTALLAALAGCAAPGPDGQAVGRETVTASEQTDADRRARVRLELATAYFSRGQLETALDELKLSLAVKPDQAEAYNLRGLVYAALGDAAVAEASFRRALQINPRDADAMHNYGWFLCQQQRFPESVAQFGQALEQPQYRGAARTLTARGLCQARAGQWMEAEGSLMRSYELDPSNPATAMNLTEVLYRRAEYERARFYIGRVNSQASSANAQTLWLAARIERKLGDIPRMRTLGDQLRARFPQSPEAQAYERGQFDE
ncbi:type IV pilus biogenesis/stability protein PilW [Ideonella sp. A 288]|uniref:type IV pilus biogenesis/stability protein PilW n=1 Tax=Ideonella sp. A 288 TaxID=1962181 RepID=UPI003855CE36